MSKFLKAVQFFLNFALVLGALLASSVLIWLLGRHVGLDALSGIAAVSFVALWAHFCPLVKIDREDS